jgi:molybdopterin/thiamine biosynthesis adenylyltransferase
MSSALIARNPDLRRLRDEGYEVSVQGSFLVLDGIPYVTGERTIEHGRLVSTLNLAGDVTAPPQPHTAMFTGARPCQQDGTPLTFASDSRQDLGEGLLVDFVLSAKPESGNYTDYYAKMSTYASLISAPASALDQSVTPKTFAVVATEEEDSVFCYLDTATSRAGIGVAAAKLELSSVAIAGLGGTGSYVLDLVAKTPVRAIHIFDDDVFHTHNAFRAPGAPTLPELRKAPLKVERFKAIYSEMHRGIVAHDYAITADNVEELLEMDFVFLCLDQGSAMRPVVERLQAANVSFVNTGIGVYEVEGSLAGSVQTTLSTASKQDHIWARHRIPLDDGDVEDEYARNIQIAELNSLNAAFAVLRWKRLFGFYVDLEHEHFSNYMINGNHLLNEDQA